jgi:hypothetical protein
MSSTHTEITPVEQALALLALPKLDDLSTAQVRGISCVWDVSEKALSEEDAIALGPRRRKRLDGEYDWHPRGCPEHVATAAMEALFTHCETDCEQCGQRTGKRVGEGVAQETSCEVGIALRRLAFQRGRR